MSCVPDCERTEVASARRPPSRDWSGEKPNGPDCPSPLLIFSSTSSGGDWTTACGGPDSVVGCWAIGKDFWGCVDCVESSGSWELLGSDMANCRPAAEKRLENFRCRLGGKLKFVRFHFPSGRIRN